jgi:UDPglucose 6-dehydrogenase
VIGTSGAKAAEIMEELYKPYVRQGNPIIIMDERSAELTKYAANAFLATKISFMNEIALLCEKVGADVDKVRIGIGTDDRIGKRFLFPGIGYGGSCFPKDVQALSKTAEQNDFDFRILKSVMDVNVRQKKHMMSRIKEHFGDSMKGLKVGVWGIAFKPDTDDIREAPSIELMKELCALGAEVTAYDPEAMENCKKHSGLSVRYASDTYEAAEGADALLIATEWAVFRSPDFMKLKEVMKRPVIFDGRNIFSVDIMRKNGFIYYSIGREAVHHS